jgi:DNA polymerase-3 subunit beta
MRATTKRQALLETLGKVKSAVAAKHTIPVVGAILIRAGGGQLTLTGTDLEVALTASCKASVSRQGAVAVLPKTLEAFLKAAKAETVTLSLVNGKSLRVEAGAVTTIEGFDAKEFPDIEGVRGKPVVVTGLANGLKQISYAMAKDDGSRPVLEGVFFHPNGGNLVLAAADGFRLAETRVKANGHVEETIVPAKAVQLVQKLMPGKVSIHRVKETREGKQNTISFVGDGVVLTAMVIQGTYPNYQQVIPKNGSPLTVDGKTLRDALDTVAITLPDNKAVRLQSGRGKLLIVSTKRDDGSSEVKVPAKGKAKVAFNMAYLKDLLANTISPITLRIKDTQSPGVVRQNGTVHVIIPMSVEW